MWPVAGHLEKVSEMDIDKFPRFLQQMFGSEMIKDNAR